MDDLQAHALDAFLENQQFLNQPPDDWRDITLLTVKKFNSETLFNRVGVRQSELLDHLKRPAATHNGEKAVATLDIVRIDRVMARTLLVNRQVFMDIFNSFELDEYWLHMLEHSIYGLYQRDKPLSHSVKDGLRTSCLCTVSFMLVWSHDSRKQSTKAIIVPRDADGLKNYEHIFAHFSKTIQHFKELINQPNFLLFVCGFELIRWIESFISSENDTIRGLEVETGHGTWTKRGQRKETMSGRGEDLARLSRQLGTTLGYLANVARHIAIVRKVLGEMDAQSQVASQASGHKQAAQSATASGTQTSNPSADAKQILEASTIFKGQIESAELHVSYLQERARMQQSVIFNLLGREDAAASKELAQAAKDDSYAMKTIAVMTMAFLPATFFAALFSTPLLQWEEQTIVKPLFWVYWAFTLPSTILVFVLWYLISSWRKNADQRTTGGRPRNGRKSDRYYADSWR